HAVVLALCACSQPADPQPAAGQTFSARGDALTAAAVTVFIRDEGLNQSNVTQPRIYLENNGAAALHDFEVHYFVTREAGLSPVVEDYWTPNSAPRVDALANNLSRIVYDYSGFTLTPGGRAPESASSSIGLHYPGYSSA